MRTAIFPGSFDPITKGHESIVRRALPLFDKVIISVGVNTTKQCCFPLEKRIEWIKKVFSKEKNVTVETYSGLTVDFCRKMGASFIIRGLRTSADFEFERAIAQMNRTMAPEIETLFLVSLPEFAAINSSIVREIYRSGGDIGTFIPTGINL
ncbi:MAG: pantetheine-phosphate adenylyltransferase [Bacteroidetes bacterium]|nr:pantetheine-phosphate adenylyltransferase [Bacteroidota bacterium]